jgi:hypothetical protein
MKPSARQLAMRDPALAAMVGAFSGSTFGAEFADEFGDEDDDYGAEFAAEFAEDDDDFGDDDDYGYDDDFGAPPKLGRGRGRGPSRAAMMRAWKRKMSSRRRSQRRNRILEPNKGSSIKVEKYTFTISEAIELGTASTFTNLTGQPDTTIRPQRVTMNAPSPLYVFIQEIKVANVSVSVGSGVEDAFNYSAQGVGQSLDMPTLSPANRATVFGQYTGFVPPGFVGGTDSFFTVSFKGPSSIVA